MFSIIENEFNVLGEGQFEIESDKISFSIRKKGNNYKSDWYGIIEYDRIQFRIQNPDFEDMPGMYYFIRNPNNRSATSKIEEEEFGELINSLPKPLKETTMTTYDQIIRKGKLQGEIEGESKGKRTCLFKTPIKKGLKLISLPN